MRRRSDRPAVVFPQPLSPTSPRVSPGASANEMSSTARTWATTWEKTPFFTGKYFFRFRTSISGAMSVHHVAGHPVARTQLPELGFDGLAALDGGGAARVELAALREAQRVRHGARDDVEALALLRRQRRTRAEEAQRVGVKGVGEQLLHRGVLDDLGG